MDATNTNAAVLKTNLLSYFLYRGGGHAAVTEKSMYFGIADVFVMMRSRYTHEIEVKVSKQDLRSELQIIAQIQNNEAVNTKAWNKCAKHERYLRLTQNSPLQEIPNRFSFAVPPELVETAMPVLENTPYGLYSVANGTYGIKYIVQARKAGLLHKEKLQEEKILSLLRKVSTEILSLRERELKLERRANGTNT